ncbi:hypothetical protein [Nonomuraea sp. NPDC049684]|uniref:hypothetical protein n=1 Tax=unclassified Nonomuraea TaxID=2593643 RepID=UPI00378E5819
MTADQPICCPTCKGVLPGRQRSDYTAARGRLVVVNGYCQGHCPAPEQPRRLQAPAEHPVPADLGTRQPLNVPAPAL